jgi:hypothetical protein
VEPPDREKSSIGELFHRGWPRVAAEIGVDDLTASSMTIPPVTAGC